MYSRKTPAVLSLGKLCEDRSRAAVDQRRENNYLQNGQFRILEADRLQHRHCRICLQQVQPKSEVTDLHQETGADHPLAKSVYKLKNSDKATSYSPVEARATPAPTSKSSEEREFVDDSGASMHVLSKKVLSSDELETLRRSRIPATVVTGNGEVQTNEEAQVCVHDLDLFVTVQVLDDTPAVLSLGKLCEEHGYACEWASGQKPRLTKQGKNLLCKAENFVPLGVPGLSSNSGTSSSSTSPPQDSSSASSAPERSDEPAPGNWHESPKTQNKNKKKGYQSSLGRRFARPSRMVRGVHRQTRRNRSACTPHTFLRTQIRNVPQKWHQGSTIMYTQLPYDRNCEACLRTKMTRVPCRIRTGEAVPQAEKFGDLITADHKVFN